MVDNKKIYQFLFKNEDKRTSIMKEMEEYLNSAIKGVESSWKLNGKIEKNTQKYIEHAEENFMQEILQLNSELRKLSEMETDTYKKDVKSLLKLESENSQTTLNIFINKLNCFDMINSGESEDKIAKKQQEITLLIEVLSSLREQINDFISNLKYKYLF